MRTRTCKVQMHEDDPHPMNGATITAVFPPNGRRTWPTSLSLTREEAEDLRDALAESLGGETDE